MLDSVSNSFENYFEIGLQLFDQDRLPIEFANFKWTQNFMRLRESLKTGDSVLKYETVGADFVNTDNPAWRGLAICGNHIFKNGKRDFGFSRAIIHNAYPMGGISGTNPNKVLSLNTPYLGSELSINTVIRNVRDEGLYKIPMLGQAIHSSSGRYKYCFAQNQDNTYSIQLHQAAKYAKFYVQQKSINYFKLVLSGISLRRIEPGAIINPIGWNYEDNGLPYEGMIFPDGFRYVEVPTNENAAPVFKTSYNNIWT